MKDKGYELVKYQPKEIFSENLSQASGLYMFIASFFLSYLDCRPASSVNYHRETSKAHF